MIFKIIGALGLILISIGILNKKRKIQDTLYIVGGLSLLTYSIYIQNIIFIIAVGSVVFSGFNYIRTPTDKNKDNILEADKRLCLLDEMLKSSQEKNGLLIEQQKNHIHTVQVTLEKTNANVKKNNDGIIELKTILNERLPRKQ